ncbi:ATP synthase F0, I subunit [Teredinibacter turnerae T7901]|uniref:ATP synthase F0, I subunit n=1 Tax=Teredinibacter turnerae (strain ATCC 39867 / T7901) TaxID=377629 RepID=C5BKK2_TERTT|nr:ATP synthase subunit I [Teredinibacter turnerae]ACR13595.1 ATP synthase F0, I subunit [Teredinibacter turnerae T7901]
MKSPALAGILAQLGFVLPVSCVLLLLGIVEAYSFALGALVYAIPNAYFTLYAFRYRGARDTALINKSFKRGESGKFALVVVGFALVFRFVMPLSYPALFAGFCSLIIFQWGLSAHLGRRWL